MDVALEKLHEGEVIVLRTQLDEAERIVLSVKSEPASAGSWTRVILAPAQ
jgi:hypothetical protein